MTSVHVLLMGLLLNAAAPPAPLPERLARFPVQGPSELATPLAPLLDEALAHWSRWPRVPQVELDGLGVMAGVDAVLACTGEDACSAEAAHLANARYVLFSRVAADAFSTALYDATQHRLVRRVVEHGAPDAALLERAVALTLAPERAVGKLRVDGATHAAVDGHDVTLPASLPSGVHRVSLDGAPAREVTVPLRGEVVLLAGAGAAPRGKALPVTLMALGALGAAAGVVLVGFCVLLTSLMVERRWTASQPDRMNGSAVTQQWVLFEAGWLERAALVAGAGAVLAGVVGMGLLGGGVSWWLWGV